MELRKKLTLLFVGIVALILLLSSGSIYYFSASHREEDFYNRLHQKGNNTAKLLLEVHDVDAELLAKMDANNPQTLHREKQLIFDYRNEVLYASPGADALLVTPHMLDEVRLAGEVRYRRDGHEVLGFMFLDTYDRFVVFVAANDLYGWRKMRNLRFILWVVCAGGILISTVLGWIYAGRALRPIARVVSEVEQISVANLHLRIEEGPSRDEIARLAATFNKMLSRLEKAFSLQKNFIANASHELRTPLTAITGQLEVVLMNERTGEEYRRTLLSVLDDIRNLNHTSNRLLLLAQANSEVARKDFKAVRIDEVAWLARAEVLRRDERFRVVVEVEESIDDEAKLTIFGNEQLLKTALINLIDNGCKYSDHHEVKVGIAAEEDEIFLTFADKGIGIPADDLKHIFEPFHRASNAITFKGHGIGLSLVKRIAELHDGSIELKSREGEGTIFTLRLPIAPTR